MTKFEAHDRLLKLSVGMLTSKATPSPFIDDWEIPKSTPKATNKAIVNAAEQAQEQIRLWAVEISEIAKSLLLDEGGRASCREVQMTDSICERDNGGDQ
jgi:hypothetical protein